MAQKRTYLYEKICVMEMVNMVIGLDVDIVPGKSIGGISLGDNVSDVMQYINDIYLVEQYGFYNNTGNYCIYKIHGGAISFTCNEEGFVIALWCEPPYKGCFGNKYYPGITVEELRSRSKKQELVKGYLVIDGNFSIYYSMPDDIDDFNDFSDLDDDIVFNELYVGNLLQ